jgi:uncharacterized protein (DUF433 family)
MARAQAQKRAVGFRWHTRTLDDLRDHVAAHGGNQTDLAELYVTEGIRRDNHPLIYFRVGAAGRRAALLGTRLDVADIISTLRQNENSLEDTAEYLDIPVAHIESVVRYYVEFNDEIDAEIERAAAVAERERSLWERQQEALR